jgi:hypothetical protein
MNALAPPPEAMQAFPGMPVPPPRDPAVPTFAGPNPPERTPPNAFDALRAAGGNKFGGQQFGGQQFGGQRFGGGQFGASAPQPPQPAGPPPQGPQSPIPPGTLTPQQQIMALMQRGQPVPQQTPMPPPQGVGYFRGGALKMMRGGYPEHLINGIPTRAAGGEAPERYVPMDGQGDGRSDHVDAKLSPGEFVMDAETVALLGNGNSDAGAKRMETIRQTLRKEKGKALAKGKFSPNAKKPGFYAQTAMKGLK